MTPEIITAIIGAIATVLAAIVAGIFARDKKKNAKETGKEIAIAELKNKADGQNRELEANNVTPSLSSDNIIIESGAYQDCVMFNIPPASVIEFLLKEALNHPSLFLASFSSTPFIFSKYVLLLSWDGEFAKVERVLSRDEAYPAHNAWLSCVSLYRQATILPYRKKKSGEILSSTEYPRSIKHYRKLLQNVNEFFFLLEKMGTSPNITINEFDLLLDEAEFAFLGDNMNTCIVRLEAFLSSIHKLLLRYAPQTYVKKANIGINFEDVPSPKIVGNEGKYILIVDDQKYARMDLIEEVINMGSKIRFAEASNPAEAMQAIVENDFDIIITDLNMPDFEGKKRAMEGRELAHAFRATQPKAKIIIWTGYSGLREMMNAEDNLDKPLYDDYIVKGKDDIRLIIKKFLAE